MSCQAPTTTNYSATNGDPSTSSPKRRPAKHSIFWNFVAWFAGALFLHGVIDPGGSNVFNWCINAMIYGWIARLLFRGIRDGHIPIDWLVRLADNLRGRLLLLLASHAPMFVIRPWHRHRAYRRSLEPRAVLPNRRRRPLQGPSPRRRRVSRRRSAKASGSRPHRRARRSCSGPHGRARRWMSRSQRSSPRPAR